METTASLADDIYQAQVLGPDRQGPRRALSLLLSAGCFGLLGGLALVLGSRTASTPAPRIAGTLSFDLDEEAPLPPPPPPAGPLLAASPAPATGPTAQPAEVPDTPAERPAATPSAAPASTPGPAVGAFGGAAGGVAGGQPGGVAGGQVGGDPTGVLPPRFDAAYLRNPEPDYPALSRRLHEEGRVVLRVLVSAEGLPQQLELRTSSGHLRLDQAALDAVRRWRFAPARRGAESLAAWVLVPLTFSLDA